MSSEMRTDCQAESIIGNNASKHTDVHARLIYSEAYLWSVDVIFFWGKDVYFNKVEMLIQEKIVDLDLQQKI